MRMRILSVVSVLLMTALGHASNLRILEDDAFSTPEKADEAAAVINQNFIEIFNSKLDNPGSDMGEISDYVSDLLDPDQADYNVMVIRGNADDLWSAKAERGSRENGTRSFELVDLLDPAEIENNIGKINQIFWELDDQKEDQ